MKRGRASKYVPAFCAAMLFCDSYKILTTRIPQNRTTVTKTKTAQKQTASIHGRQYGKANGRGNHSNQAGSFNDDLIPNSHHSRAAVYKPKTKKSACKSREIWNTTHCRVSCWAFKSRNFQEPSDGVPSSILLICILANSSLFWVFRCV